jgi:hypothetical protein
MEKKDEILLIIAKSFGKQRLTKEEVLISKNLSVSFLISKLNLTVDQSQEVINWCVISCASLQSSTEILEEGLFNFLNKFKKDKSEVAFKGLIEKKSNAQLIPSFLRDVSELITIIQKEGGIKDYRDNKKNHPPSSDWNVERITNITRKLLTLEFEFKKFGSTKSARISESFDVKDLNQKAASMSINMKLSKMNSNGYYNKRDLTTMVIPMLREAQRHYKLSRKERDSLAKRFYLFILNLKNSLTEVLSRYYDATKHGTISLSRNENRPKQIKHDM